MQSIRLAYVAAYRRSHHAGIVTVTGTRRHYGEGPAASSSGRGTPLLHSTGPEAAQDSAGD